MSSKGKIFFGGITYYIMISDNECQRLPSNKCSSAYPIGQIEYYALSPFFTSLDVKHYLREPGAYIPDWAKHLFPPVITRHKVEWKLP